MKLNLSAFLHTEPWYNAIFRKFHTGDRCNARSKYLISLLSGNMTLINIDSIHMCLKVVISGYAKAKCKLT